LGPTRTARTLAPSTWVRGSGSRDADLLCRLRLKIPQAAVTADIDNRKGYAESHLHFARLHLCAGMNIPIRAEPR